MTGVSDERWEQQNRRTRDVEYVRECIGRFEMEDFGDEPYDWAEDHEAFICHETAGGFESVGDRGWTPVPLFRRSARLSFTAGAVVGCTVPAAVVEAVRLAAALIRTVTG